MNLVLYILIKCGQGGGEEGVKKSENFADVNGWPLMLQGHAKKTLLSSVRKVLFELIGCAWAA